MSQTVELYFRKHACVDVLKNKHGLNCIIIIFCTMVGCPHIALTLLMAEFLKSCLWHQSINNTTVLIMYKIASVYMFIIQYEHLLWLATMVKKCNYKPLSRGAILVLSSTQLYAMHIFVYGSTIASPLPDYLRVGFDCAQLAFYVLLPIVGVVPRWWA